MNMQPLDFEKFVNQKFKQYKAQINTHIINNPHLLYLEG